MTVVERRARYVLAVCVAAVVAVTAIYGITGNFAEAMGGLGVLGLEGAAPVIGLREKRRGEVIVDERDRAILQSAGRIAFAGLWLAASVLVVGLSVGGASTVRVSAIVSAAWFAWLLLSAIHASSVLWMCGLQRAR